MNKYPDFLCIGTQKAGTSWLFEQFRQHPCIWMPPIKEIHFFDHLFCEDNRKWTLWHIQQSASHIIKYHAKAKKIDFEYINYISSLACGNVFDEQWYSKAFNRKAAQNKKIGDITPEYCTIGKEGVRYVAELLDQPKILWLIREPVSRALSQLRMNVSRTFGDNPISDDVWMQYAMHPSIINRGLLSVYIPEWEEVFSADKILYLSYKEISQNPVDLLRTTEKFLEIPAFENYASPNKVIHEGVKMNVPAKVTSYLNEQLAAERSFLISKFGEKFI
jgi:hypothetical protein